MSWCNFPKVARFSNKLYNIARYEKKKIHGLGLSYEKWDNCDQVLSGDKVCKTDNPKIVVEIPSFERFAYQVVFFATAQSANTCEYA